MRNHASLNPIIQTVGIFVIAVPGRQFAIGASIITIHIAGIGHVVSAVTLLNIPVKRIIRHRNAIQPNAVCRTVMLAGIHAIVCPCLRQEFFQRDADI